jgi:hypothetical protein
MSIKSHQSCFTLSGGGMIHGFSVCACFGSGAEFCFGEKRNFLFWGLYTIREDYLIREVIGLNKINKI